ncbi:MAG: 3-ketoacyl-ACP reductase [Deltaproteobacteria bacterium]|nr:MAG: 3-ketoacyl-ACP reductase [Deltaproteobacteria bacterium]
MIYFITGGSRGIGANLVKRAVEAGHDVAFTYATAADQAKEVVAQAKALRPEANCRCYQLELRSREQIESVVDQAADDFDTIDVVVNNAGINRDSLLMAMTDEEWDEVIATNLTGPFMVCRAALPVLIANRYGRIINISSVVAEGATGQTNYAASKAGLHGLTKSIAKEYGRKRITANVVVPGFFETDMTREHMPEEIRSFWKQYAPMPKGRGGELDELAAVIMFLASKEAAFVNGQELRVTGGLDWNP